MLFRGLTKSSSLRVFVPFVPSFLQCPALGTGSEGYNEVHNSNGNGDPTPPVLVGQHKNERDQERDEVAAHKEGADKNESVDGDR